MKILVVEDEKELVRGVSNFLQRDGYLCEVSDTRRDALVKVAMYSYDCVLLDLMLPDGSGLDVLRKLKAKSPATGVIIVSAKNSVDDKVEGLRLGADDYLAKPFSLSELAMRVMALLRRRYTTADGDRVTSDGLEIDLLKHEVSVGGILLNLTHTEFDLLLFLVGNKERVVSKMAIAEHLSGEMSDVMDNFNFIFAHIKNLKHKLEDVGLSGHIRTVYGTGYKWTEE